MSTLAIYYLETNLICMLFMAFVLYSYMHESKGLAEARWFIASILGVEIYCFSDILSACFKNRAFTGARMILWTSNAVYISMPLVLAIIWQRYSINHMRRFHVLDKKFDFIDRVILYASVIICLLSLSSPITHFSFNLDELNGYHRSLGAYVVPALSYAFLMVEWVKARLIAKECNDLEVKTEARAMSLLPIPCVFFSLLQVFYYGITTAQVGFTMGYMIVYLSRQQNAISKDELTGLNNRRQFEFAIDRLTRSVDSAFVAMIDVDGFKKINDTWGHAEGDTMLKSVATILHRVCDKDELPGNFTVYRYGGDEFAILSSSFEAENINEMLSKSVEEEVSNWNDNRTVEYKMSLSVGSACNRLGDEDIHQLIARADKEMYRVKNSRKAQFDFSSR